MALTTVKGAVLNAFSSRSALVAFISTNTELDGTVVSDGEVDYIASSGSSGISDLPGWLPYGIVTANHFGAVEGGSVNARDAFHNAAAYLDGLGGGVLSAIEGTYLIESEWTLPCGVDFVDSLGRITLKYTEVSGNGIYCTTNSSRLGQHSRIYGITFGRSGSTGGKAIYTEDDNAPFFTQSPHWDIQRCSFFDLDATYTLPPSPFTGGPQYGWLTCFDIHHSNGTRIVNNNVYGYYSPYSADAGQDDSTAVRLGTAGTNGVIAVEIRHNRFWYCRTVLAIEEDVLAFWFEANECIKCYRGIYAAADPGGDGTVSQADTRIRDNFITVVTTAIDISNRQLMHIVGNHTNSDAGYTDAGNGFIGIKLTDCTKYQIRGNSANLAAGHASWTGTHRAISLNTSDVGSITDQDVSRYFDEGIYFNTTDEVSVNGIELRQLTDAGFAFEGACRDIIIGIVLYPDAEPTERYKFYDSNTDINDLSITADEFVVPASETSLTVTSNAVTVDRSSHQINTGSGPQTLNNATGESVRSSVIMTLRASSSANALTVTDGAGGSGQFLLATNFVTTNARDILTVKYNQALDAWIELSRSDNA